MDELQIIGRKILLKEQAIPLIRREIDELRDKESLLRLKGELEDQIKEYEIDPILSQ